MNTIRKALAYALTLIASGATWLADKAKPRARVNGGGGKGEER